LHTKEEVVGEGPEQRASRPKRVLVTGAAGAIGSAVSRYLVERGHSVRGFDLNPMPHLKDATEGDLTDRSALDAAIAGMETVVHLGAFPDEADFMSVLLEPNVIGLYQTFDAARAAGVQRMIFASTIQTIRGYGWPEDQTLTASDPVKPTNHYALAKIWGEQMNEMYARCFNMSALNVRILWVPRSPEHAGRLDGTSHGKDIYFSPVDAQRFFACAVESENPQPGECVTLFAGSIPFNKARIDLEPAKRILGYEPTMRWPEGLPFALNGARGE
jgi:uronate dehydrogenase